MSSLISRVELEGLLSAFFTVSKRRWAYSLLLQGIAVAIGTASVILGSTSLWGGIAVTAVATASSLARWRSAHLRAAAEALLCQKEFRDGLGWDPDSRLVADLKATHSKLAALAIKRQEEQSEFYDTKVTIGPSRMIEMVRESAWWTSQNSSFCSRAVAYCGGLLVVSSLYGTMISWIATTGEPNPTTLVSLLTSVVSLVFALDIARLFFEYQALEREAEAAFSAAEALLERAELADCDALRPVLRYQVARALAPPIPDWVWRLRRDNLNSVWQAELARTPNAARLGTTH